MKKENEFCECENVKSVYAVQGEWGYWLHCSKCDMKIEDEFHYHNEPDDLY